MLFTGFVNDFVALIRTVLEGFIRETINNLQGYIDF